MSFPAFTVLRGSFLKCDDVKLGCLVPDPLHPHVDRHPLQPYSFSSEEVSTSYVENVHQLLSKEKHVGLRSQVSRILSGELAGDHNSSIDVVAPISTVYSLKQPISHFLQICKDESTRAWMEDTRRLCGGVYLIVGVVTVTTAKVEVAEHRSKQYGGGVEVPVAEMVSFGIATIVPVVDDVVNPGANISAHHKTNAAFSFTAPGERILGIQYRKVQFRWFSSDDVPKLGSNQWESCLTLRGSGIEDIVSVDVEQALLMSDT